MEEIFSTKIIFNTYSILRILKVFLLKLKKNQIRIIMQKCLGIKDGGTRQCVYLMKNIVIKKKVILQKYKLQKKIKMEQNLQQLKQLNLLKDF